MKRVLTSSEMKHLDDHTIQVKEVPSCVLMERAALKTVEEMEKSLKDHENILVVCGSGNNGGDGMAIARLLWLKGRKVSLYFAGNKERMTPEAARQWQIAGNYHVPEVHNPVWSEYTTIVDAIFGVGLSRPVEGHYADVIRQMNYSDAFKVAVDIPSGVDSDTGLELGIAFLADLTVTFAFCKRGLVFYPGRMYAGRVVTADIGICQEKDAPVGACCLEEEDLKLLPGRIPYGNKGTFGKILLIAGSEGMCGAAFLCASAAFKTGAGMVRIQTVEENRVPLQVLLPEAIISCEFSESENEKMLSWCDILVIGPGLGASGKSRERAQWFLEKGTEKGIPVVLDADGLNLLALHPQWKQYLNGNVILTPHIGEMSRLSGKSIGEIQKTIADTAAAYAKENGCICVLKDACTVIADEKGALYLNLSGNAGMATAGSGDALTGILAGILAMYLKEKEAPDNGKKAALGVYLHGICGDMAAAKQGQRSMTARDIVDQLPAALTGGKNE